MSGTEVFTLGQIADLLSSSMAFSGMPKKEAIRVAEMMAMRRFEPHDHLTEEGAENQGHLMLVVSGEARITSKIVNDVETLVYRLAKPGHVIGEVGFIDGRPHSATCTATCQMQVAVLKREQLAVLIEQEPKAAMQLMAGLLKIMAQRLRHSNTTIQTLGVVHLGLQKEIENLKKAQQ